MDKLCQEYQQNYGLEPLAPEVKEHAAHCKACQTFAARQEAVRECLPDWQAPAGSPDFDLHLMARIAEQQSRPTSLSDLVARLASFRVSIPLPAGAAVVVLLAVSLILNMFTWLHEPPVPPQEKMAQTTHAPLRNVDYTNGANLPLQTTPITYGELFHGTGGVGVILIAPQPLASSFPYTIPEGVGQTRETDL
jgi:hypothetical protein